MAKNNLVSSKYAKSKFSLEKDEKKSIWIGLVVSVVVIIAVALALFAIRKKGLSGASTVEATDEPEFVVESTDGLFYVANQEQLDIALEGVGAEGNEINTVIIQSEEEQSIVIGEGSYPEIQLQIDSPYTEVENSASFGSILINQIASSTWVEKGQDNYISIDASSAHIIVSEGASVSLIENMQYGSTLAVENYGNIDNINLQAESSITSILSNGTIGMLTIFSNTNLSLSGTMAESCNLSIESGGSGSVINTSLPILADSNAGAKYIFNAGSEASSVSVNYDYVKTDFVNETGADISITDPERNEKVLKAGEELSIGEDSTPVESSSDTSSSTSSTTSGTSTSSTSSSTSSSSTSSTSTSTNSSSSSTNSGSNSSTTTATNATITTTTTTNKTTTEKDKEIETLTAEKKTLSEKVEALTKEVKEALANLKSEQESNAAKIETANTQIAALQQKIEQDCPVEAPAEGTFVKEVKTGVGTDNICVAIEKKVATVDLSNVDNEEYFFITNKSGYDLDDNGKLIVNSDTDLAIYKIEIRFFYFDSDNNWIGTDFEPAVNLRPGGSYVFSRKNPGLSTASKYTYRLAVSKVEPQEGTVLKREKAKYTDPNNISVVSVSETLNDGSLGNLDKSVKFLTFTTQNSLFDNNLRVLFEYRYDDNREAFGIGKIADVQGAVPAGMEGAIAIKLPEPMMESDGSKKSDVTITSVRLFSEEGIVELGSSETPEGGSE